MKSAIDIRQDRLKLALEACCKPCADESKKTGKKVCCADDEEQEEQVDPVVARLAGIISGT